MTVKIFIRHAVILMLSIASIDATESRAASVERQVHGQAVDRCVFDSMKATIQAQAAETEKLNAEHKVTPGDYAKRWNIIHSEQGRIQALKPVRTHDCPRQMSLEKLMRASRSM